ncbi:hypothetical protein ACFL6E_07535 [Candidatus Neomarinimicrobiota bacterium]
MIRPLLNKHAKDQMSESLRYCYAILRASKNMYEHKGEMGALEEIYSALNQYRNSISKNPRFSKQTGHAEMYRKIWETVRGEKWSGLDTLLSEIEKMDETIRN